MKKVYILSIITIIVFGLSFLKVYDFWLGEKPNKRIQDSMFRIEVYSDNDDVSDLKGIGFAINKNTILTNYHVIQCPQKIVVFNSKNNQLSSRLYRYDVKSDLAIIKTNTDDLIPLKLETTPLNKGEQVFYIKDSKVFKGSVINEHYSLSGTNTILKYIRIEGLNAKKGDSGSPIINSTGEVVGIVSAISDNKGKILTYATPINDTYKILEYLLKDQDYPHKLLGIKIDELPNYHKQYPGLKISQVLKGSVAYQKLQIGDVIKKYNDLPIITYQDLGYALFNDNNASNTTLLIQRDGNLMNIEILKNE